MYSLRSFFCALNSFCGKEFTCHAGDSGSILGSGRSPGERNGNPLQYSCLENPTEWSLRSYSLSSVQFSCSVVSDSAIPWIAAQQASLSITISWSSLRLVSIESVMPSSHLTLCHPLLLLPPIPPSIRVFSSESTLRMWPPHAKSYSLLGCKRVGHNF